MDDPGDGEWGDMGDLIQDRIEEAQELLAGGPMEATKRPWTFKRDGDYWSIEPTEIRGKDNYEGNEADYQLIVRAVNTFDQAREALKDAIKGFRAAMVQAGIDDEFIDIRLKKANEALSAMEAKP